MQAMSSLDRKRLGWLLSSVAALAMALPAAWPAAAPAQEAARVGTRPARKTPPDRYAPTVMPDRIILTFYGDTCTSRAVTWRTSTKVEQACAEIVPAATGQRFLAKIKGQEFKNVVFANELKRVAAQTDLFELGELKFHEHAVRFEDLAPETRYLYRVGDGKNWSEWFQFRTASRESKPFRFLYFGDSQNNIRSMCSWVFRAAYAAAPDAAFTLHAGDLINNWPDDAEWAEWFYAGGWINATVPAVLTPGNHDHCKELPDGSPGYRLTPYWRAQFTLPENGPEGLEENAYYIDYQGARIVSLNSCLRLEEQAAWLDQILSNKRNAWTILTFHFPIYAVASNRTSGTRALLKPLIDKHKVDLVLTGHDHAYSRSKLIGPAGPQAADPAGGGTIYVVSVCGPKMNRLGPAEGEPADFEKRVAEDTQFYQIVSIDGRTLRFEAWTPAGELYDAFTLKKSPNGTNELIDQIPPTPQRRRKAPETAPASAE